MNFLHRLKNLFAPDKPQGHFGRMDDADFPPLNRALFGLWAQGRVLLV